MAVLGAAVHMGETFACTVIIALVLGHGRVISRFRVYISTKTLTEHASLSSVAMVSQHQHHTTTEFSLAPTDGKL